MCAATPPVLSVAMPWELPGVRLVLGEDEPMVPTPILYPMPITDNETSHSQPSDRIKTPWFLEFVKVSKLADRPLDTLHNAPLLPAPTEDGGWTNRSTSTQEAKKWLLSVLSRGLGKDPEMTTIHCLKSIALSWAGKAGLNAETRQVLGRHSTGKHSHEIFNRQGLVS